MSEVWSGVGLEGLPHRITERGEGQGFSDRSGLVSKKRKRKNHTANQE